MKKTGGVNPPGRLSLLPLGRTVRSHYLTPSSRMQPTPLVTFVSYTHGSATLPPNVLHLGVVRTGIHDWLGLDFYDCGARVFERRLWSWSPPFVEKGCPSPVTCLCASVRAQGSQAASWVSARGRPASPSVRLAGAVVPRKHGLQAGNTIPPTLFPFSERFWLSTIDFGNRQNSTLSLSTREFC